MKLSYWIIIIIALIGCKENELTISENFPFQDFDKIVGYKLIGECCPDGYGCSIVENDTLSLAIKGNGKELSSYQSKRLIKTLNNKSYRSDLLAMCFTPRIGYVFYKNEEITAYTSICYECFRLRSSPKYQISINEKGIDKLMNLEKQLFGTISEPEKYDYKCPDEILTKIKNSVE